MKARWPVQPELMKWRRPTFALALLVVVPLAPAFQAQPSPSSEKRRNNLVAELLHVFSISGSNRSFGFNRSSDGWTFFSTTGEGDGTLRVVLDSAETVIVHDAPDASHREAMLYLAKGRHTIRVESSGSINLQNLEVKAIPELMHCGLGFNPEIKSYGVYDWDFLRRDILPNVTTLIVPNNIQLAERPLEEWHRQGKKFVAEVGISSQAKTAEEHAKFWNSVYDKTPFLDGLIINEFIVNRPVAEWAELNPERLGRIENERKQYETYGEAIKKMRADNRYKMFYAYVGGSGKELNQEIIGTNFVRTIKDCGYRVALERYLHEMSNLQGSREALQTFVNGVADWEVREPGVTEKLIVTFGLFSMPPGGINKQPNVDYHVWMDQQMNLVANHPTFRGIAGLNWWTSLLADEETVRFVGKLYRHYAIEGNTNLLTRDPLFLTHIQNADFEKGTEGWTLHPAEEGSISARSFPRYGRIEGRYMGLGRPADPEHIGDTFLWMKRSKKGPNTFYQTIKDLQPGRLYSMKMFSCDYQDLVNAKARKMEEAMRFIGSVTLEGVEVAPKKSFAEMYSSNPEPKIPVWITYHWKVFRAKSVTATLIVSDWPSTNDAGNTFGQEQTFNFLEIQPYHE
jgi:hypothetical protein